MKRLILDTNVVVRFLLGEPPEQAKAAANLFEESDRREIELVLEPLVVAESIFVLTSFYKKSRVEVAGAMALVMGSAGVDCLRLKETERALHHFRISSAHWVDCFLAAISEISGLPVASFDRDFDSLTGATRTDPASL